MMFNWYNETEVFQDFGMPGAGLLSPTIIVGCYRTGPHDGPSRIRVREGHDLR